MYSGKQYRVKLRFINRLLDTAVERFGRKGDTQEDYRFVNTAPIYTNLDEGHFTVEATVEVSDQFYGWVLGFGRRVKILEPEPVVEGFKAYLDKVREMYES
jgi:predicted DNA-binding transcriptional regulator YafY